ncbi:MAG TPA: S1C family serine protease [Chloroflexia bacterium]|nr:S1C family serine protease [Chloroflexia bacterium]
MRSVIIFFVLGMIFLSACDTGENLSTPTPIPTATATATATATLTHTPTSTSTSTPTSTATSTSTPTATPICDIPCLVEKLRPSVVLVEAQLPATALDEDSWGYGTGVVYDALNGYIITAEHIVEGASSVTIWTSGSSKPRSARIVGRASCDDLAVLKVEMTDGLVAAKLVTGSDLRSGSDVIALGYPYTGAPDSELSVSTGVVSKLHVQIGEYNDLIEMTAPIAPGSSGGPLLNRRGEVVGINVGGLGTGYNFAISMSYVLPILPDLENGVNHDYLGLNLYPNLYKQYFGTDEGVVVIGVATGSPGDQVGFKPEDLLLEVEGSKVNSRYDVCSIVRSHTSGDRLKVKVRRISNGGVQTCEGQIVLGQNGGPSGNLLCIGAGKDGSNSPGGEEQVILLNSDFESGRVSPWLLDQHDGISWTAGDGYYTISINANSPAYSFPDQGNISNLHNGAVVAVAKATGMGRFGLSARYSLTGNQESKYACWIDNARRVGCFKTVAGGDTQLIAEYKSSAVKPYQPNELVMAIVENELVFAVNGEIVARVTDDSLSSGTWGMYAATDRGGFAAHYDGIAIVEYRYTD